jgi:hypothetical protein
MKHTRKSKWLDQQTAGPWLPGIIHKLVLLEMNEMNNHFKLSILIQAKSICLGLFVVALLQMGLHAGARNSLTTPLQTINQINSKYKSDS